MPAMPVLRSETGVELPLFPHEKARVCHTCMGLSESIVSPQMAESCGSLIIIWDIQILTPAIPRAHSVKVNAGNASTFSAAKLHNRSACVCSARSTAFVF
jgi:hypothetical protein